VKILATALLGGLITATLVRTAPGYGSTEERLDPRRNAENLRRLEAATTGEANVIRYYAAFLVNYARGDLGQSALFQKPVRALIADRILSTAVAVGAGLVGGWVLALVIGVLGAFRFGSAFHWPVQGAAVLLQSIPASVLAFLLLVFGWRGAVACAGALALILYPRLVQYVFNLVETAAAMPHCTTARAKGVGELSMLLRHTLPVILPELIALTGVSVSMALSVSIPLEMILDAPGIGQLAWQAALGRDMTLLVNLTILFSIVISAANGMAGCFSARRSGERMAI